VDRFLKTRLGVFVHLGVLVQQSLRVWSLCAHHVVVGVCDIAGPPGGLEDLDGEVHPYVGQG
jgi:hypothetical protein